MAGSGCRAVCWEAPVPKTLCPTATSGARCRYLLAKCSIREWVSACGSIGEEAGLQETHTGQQGLQSSPKTWAWRGCPAHPGLAGRLKPAPPKTRCSVSPEQAALHPGQHPPSRCLQAASPEMLLPAEEPTPRAGSVGTARGTHVSEKSASSTDWTGRYPLCGCLLKYCLERNLFFSVVAKSRMFSLEVVCRERTVAQVLVGRVGDRRLASCDL